METKYSQTNSTRTSLRGALDQGTRVVQVEGGTVHAVHDHGVPSVCFAGTGLVTNLTVELAFLVLVQGVDP